MNEQPTSKEVVMHPCPLCGCSDLETSPWPANRASTEWVSRCGNPDCGCEVRAPSFDECAQRWNRRLVHEAYSHIDSLNNPAAWPDLNLEREHLKARIRAADEPSGELRTVAAKIIETCRAVDGHANDVLVSRELMGKLVHAWEHPVAALPPSGHPVPKVDWEIVEDALREIAGYLGPLDSTAELMRACAREALAAVRSAETKEGSHG